MHSIIEEIWIWTNCVCLALRLVFVVHIVDRMLQFGVRVRWTQSRVEAGDGTVLSETVHILCLPFVGHQVPDFLTEELLNSLNNRRKKSSNNMSKFVLYRFCSATKTEKLKIAHGKKTRLGLKTKIRWILKVYSAI